MPSHVHVICSMSTSKHKFRQDNYTQWYDIHNICPSFGLLSIHIVYTLASSSPGHSHILSRSRGEKSGEYVWDHCYVTGRKWWTRLVRNVDSVCGNWVHHFWPVSGLGTRLYAHYIWFYYMCMHSVFSCILKKEITVFWYALASQCVHMIEAPQIITYTKWCIWCTRLSCACTLLWKPMTQIIFDTQRAQFNVFTMACIVALLWCECIWLNFNLYMLTPWHIQIHVTMGW